MIWKFGDIVESPKTSVGATWRCMVIAYPQPGNLWLLSLGDPFTLALSYPPGTILQWHLHVEDFWTKRP